MTLSGEKISYSITEVQTNPRLVKIFGLSFFLAIIVHLINLFLYIQQIIGFEEFISFLIFFGFPTFLSYILFYNEWSAKHDFLDITVSGIAFRSTPVFPHGLIPKKGKISFKNIQRVSLVQISTHADISRLLEKHGSQDSSILLTRPILMYILLKNEKHILIGERFPNSKLIQATVLVEAGAGLTQTWARLTKKFPTLTSTLTDITDKFSKWFKKEV
ncbi:MAG: hypothetical protein ACFFD1_02975 [Candidatus Thorarchaeota archaeon]